jgi:two-component system sensor histidine kinase UhpB
LKFISKNRNIIIGFTCVLAFWALDTVLDTYVFNEGTFSENILGHDPVEIWMRLLIFVIIIVFGFYIKETRQAAKVLKRSQEKTRTLALHLQNIQEEERARIARDIHDDLGQLLTALEFDIAYITKRLSPDQSELLKKAKEMSELIKVSTNSVQRIASDLSPPLLGDLGLTAAMTWQAEKYQEQTGIDCSVTFEIDVESYDKELSTVLFRAFQEALTNVARHSGATSVSTSLKEDVGQLILNISDNGKGIKDEDILNKGSFGLLAMKERFHPFNGNVSIKGIKDKGTTISITVPFESCRG